MHIQSCMSFVLDEVTRLSVQRLTMHYYKNTRSSFSPSVSGQSVIITFFNTTYIQHVGRVGCGKLGFLPAPLTALFTKVCSIV